jgi:hypothetical protein
MLRTIHGKNVPYQPCLHLQAELLLKTEVTPVNCAEEGKPIAKRSIAHHNF